MVNTDKLKGRIVEKRFTKTTLALELGISANSLGRYVSGKSDIPGRIIVAMGKALGIPKTELPDYFFADYVAENATKTA